MFSVTCRVSLFIMFPLLLFSQLMILRALGNECRGNYSQANLCALEGSTVFMNITSTHPSFSNVTSSFWAINQVEGKESTDLREEPGFSKRVEYLGGRQNQFSLRLSDVKKTDEHVYYARIQRTTSIDNYLFCPGVTLRVTDLKMESPDEVVEGNKTVLKCSATCSLSDAPAFIWYKNDRLINTKQNKMNTLTLQPTKAVHTGSYSCAVKGYEKLCAPARILSVKHRPKNVSVSISPSGEILEGSSVNLTCSGDANPPVETYIWFKGETSVKKGKTYNMFRISTQDSGDYKCKCGNEVGHQYSDSVTLSVVDAKSKVQTAVIAVIITSLLLLSLILTVLRLRSKNMFCWSEEQTGKHELHVAVQLTASDAPHDNQEEIPYANIAYSRNSKGSASSNPVLYASAQHRRDEAEEHYQEEEVQYSTVHISSSHRPEAETVKQSSVIYSM